MSFSDKVVIVTGASNGIGRVIARTYAQKGANVVLADIDEETGMKITSEIMENGGSAIFVKTDVRKEEDIQKLIDTTESNFKTIDIVINNAGKGMFKSPYDVTLEEWDDVINTNLRSVFLCSREAAKVMRRNKAGGAIVNIASTRAFMSEPSSEAYAATKGGIVSLTHALAASFSEDRITVNAISPGWIETGDYSQLRMVDHDQHFSKRVGKPEDVAGACLYLTSETNNFVTGTNLTIDGGMTRKMIYEE
jgi:NAD(P)-dependent dehydrogenase (short-subunit alcohol dehydrogenase family)